MGFVAALELVADKASRARFDDDGGAGTLCRNFAVESGLVMRAVGDTMIIAPPLTISRDQIDQLMDRAVTALDKTRAALGR